MAFVQQGNQGPVFGLIAETAIGLVQDFDIDEKWDNASVRDNLGQEVTYGQYNQHWEGQIVLVDITAGSIPATYTSVVIQNIAAAVPSGAREISGGKVLITERKRKPEQKDFQKYTLSFKAWAAITNYVT